MQTKNGSLYPMQQQELFSGIPRYMWTAGEAAHEDEEYQWSWSTA
jgi:hypothetical protein